MNETRVVPVEASEETLAKMVQFAMRVSLNGSYSWTDYMRDLYATAIAAPPTADAQGDDARDGARWRKLCALLKSGSATLIIDMDRDGNEIHYYGPNTVTEAIDRAQAVPGD